MENVLSVDTTQYGTPVLTTEAQLHVPVHESLRLSAPTIHPAVRYSK